MIARTTPTINVTSQLQLLAVGKISGGRLDLRVAPPGATRGADVVLAATSWGRQLFNDGADRTACRNCHEEAGYDEAAAELDAVIDEVHAKPGLGVASVSVSEADEEPSWANFLLAAAEEDDRSDAYAAGQSDFANFLPNVADSYPDVAQQTAYANGYTDAQLGKWAQAEADDLEEDMLDREWHARGGW